MITSIDAIRGRLDRFRKQRITLTVRRSRLFRDDETIDPNAVVKVNGIFLFVTRPASRALSSIRLHLADVLVDGEPYPFSIRRRSRKTKRWLHPISISLTDIVWPLDASFDPSKEGRTSSNGEQSGRFAKGKAGFLARLLPAPGTPPDDQIDAQLPPGSGRRDSNSMDPLKFQRVFNAIRAKIRLRRRGIFVRLDEEDFIIYDYVMSLLRKGMKFRHIAEGRTK